MREKACADHFRPDDCSHRSLVWDYVLGIDDTLRKAIRFPNLQLILFFVVKSQRTFPQNSQVEQGKQYSSLLKYDCDDKLLGCRDTNLPVAAIDCGTPWKIDSIAPQNWTKCDELFR